MKHWLLMFKPDTYEIVTERGVIGVHHMHRRRFAEMADGDKFIAYISRQRVLDGYGTIVGQPYEDTDQLWPGRALYPQRCRVAFARVGAQAPSGDLLWELDAWDLREKPLNTQPWNMLFCLGGFMEVPESDYLRLVGVMA